MAAGRVGGILFRTEGSPMIPGGRDSRAIAEAWVERMVQAIRKHDREGLVTVGVIPWAGMAESEAAILAPGGSPSRFRQRPLLSQRGAGRGDAQGVGDLRYRQAFGGRRNIPLELFARGAGRVHRRG